MKVSTNQIIVFIVAFLIGIFATSLYYQNAGYEDSAKDDKVTEEMSDASSEENIEEVTMEEVSAPSTKSITPAAATTTTKTNSAYSGGTCTPSLSGKKDTSFNAILLNWTPCSNLDEFQFYKLVRSETNANPSYPGDYVAFSSSNKNAANYIDKTVARAKTYHYRMCVVQRLGKTTCSNTVTISY